MKNDKKLKRLRRLGILALIIVAIAAGMILGVRLGGRNLPGLTVAGIPVGGLTEGETLKLLTESGITERSLTVKTYGDICGEITAVDAGIVMPLWNCVEAAHDYGRSGGANVIEYFKALRGTEYEVNTPDVAAGDAAIRALAENICSRYEATLGSGEWLVDKDSAELSFVKGGGTVRLDCEGLCSAIRTALSDGVSEIEYYQFESEPEMPDFSAILSEICSEPVSAKLSDDGRYRIIPGKSSYSFDVEQAQELWTEAKVGDKVAVPLTEIFPEVTESDLEIQLYGREIVEACVSYAGVSAKQLSNIKKACSALNGTVILPGAELSFLEAAGPLTLKNGYENAPAYTGTHAADANGSEPGGGVGRVSTALYQAALTSGFTICDRTPHRYEPDFSVNSLSAYVGSLLEGGEKDLVISNPSDTPVKIRAKLDERTKLIAVAILGAE